MHKILVFCVFIFMALKCGKSSDKKTTTTSAANNQTTTTPATTSASTITSSPEVSMALVGANMNEATSSISAGDLSSDIQTGLLLWEQGLASTNSFSKTRSCVENSDGTVTVSITFTGSSSKESKNKKVSTTRTATGSESRVWSYTTGTAQKCGNLKKRVNINWSSASQVNNAQLVDTTARDNKVVTTFVRNTETSTRTLEDTETGTRTVTWTLPSGATDVSTVTKTIVSDVTHTTTLTKVDGSTSNISATHATLSEQPLVVTKTTEISTGFPKTFTINSGTMSISKTGSFYLTNTYDSVVFDLSSADPCTPTSGTITTNIYASSTDTTVLKTLTTTFSSSGPSVSTGTGTATSTSTSTEDTDNFTESINHTCALTE